MAMISIESFQKNDREFSPLKSLDTRERRR